MLKNPTPVGFAIKIRQNLALAGFGKKQIRYNPSVMAQGCGFIIP